MTTQDKDHLPTAQTRTKLSPEELEEVFAKYGRPGELAPGISAADKKRPVIVPPNKTRIKQASASGHATQKAQREAKKHD